MRRTVWFVSISVFLTSFTYWALYVVGPLNLSILEVWRSHSVRITLIEACSCFLFCSCYTSSRPQHNFCEFNIAGHVNSGEVGGVRLDGVRYWLAGDLSDQFAATGRKSWVVVTFDSRTSSTQRKAVLRVLTKVHGNILRFADFNESEIDWEIDQNGARASLSGGKGYMKLERYRGYKGADAILSNVGYWNSALNDGFILHRSKVHRWSGFGHEFSYSGRNAFTIEIEVEGLE